MTTTKTHIEKYPAYKDSGVEWMSEIPEGWEVNRLKSKIFLLTGYPFKSDKYANIGIKLARGINVKEGYFDWSDKRCWPEVSKELEPFLLKEGDVLIAMDGSKVGKNFCQVKEDDLPVLLLQRVARLRTKNGLLPNFLYWNIVSKSFLSWVNISKTDPMVPHIAPKDINNFIIAIPSPSEQTAIANFLDDKTAKIDLAIAQKEKMITLLKERKQIIIQNAVTGKWSMINGQWSMTPKEKLKDSGVEWIGEIRENWEVEKLFGVCRFVRGNSTFSKDELLSSGDYIALQYGKSYKVAEVDEKYEFYVNNEFYKDSQVVNHGDTIFISTSETIEDLGHSVFYKRNDLGLLGGEQMLLKPNMETVNSKYLYFSSTVFSKELRKYATGIKVFRFNINDLKTIFTPVPPIAEQNLIVQHIELQSTKTDKAIALQKQQIEKLKELKSTLIDSAVTGKIKVS
ncbi:MAG: restriction endonuclease subunit S [Saprospiraceae bacterium]